MNIKQLPAVYQKIQKVLEADEVFLVGGAVRDLFLQNPIHDLDFTLSGSPEKIGKRLADRLDGDFYHLDPERGAVRVILHEIDQGRTVVDFTSFQGNTIEEDLQARDFTITAMAIKLHQPERLIDPCHGLQDLKKGVIRSCGPGALESDPLRCLRGVRMAAQYEFRIHPETIQQIRAAVPLLRSVSAERCRDELFRVFDGPHLSAAVHTLEHLEILPVLGFQKSGGHVLLKRVEATWRLLKDEYQEDLAANWALGLVVARLGRFRSDLRKYAGQEFVPGRNIYQLSFLAGLTLWENHSGSRLVLPLSNQEARFVRAVVEAGKTLRDQTVTQQSEGLTVYRFFRNFQAAGVCGVLLGLSTLLEKQSPDFTEDLWERKVDLARLLLEGWWENYDRWVDPPQILDGNDLQEELGLEPGPKLGMVLEKIREAQAADAVSSRKEAVQYLQNLEMVWDDEDE